ncbi:MAG: ABC transporter substrate-binding protein [Desulfobacterales bacterium]|nr:ABC transporter substrate-binding protein [Desulfobacterales bacterium]
MLKLNNLKNKSYILAFVFIFAFSCSPNDAIEKRVQVASESTGDITIGVVGTSILHNYFLDGVNLAIEEINQRGGVLGKKIKTLIYDDQGDQREAQKIAVRLAKNYKVIAVVGHGLSDAAIPAAVIYENSGIIYISYRATDPLLTRYSSGFTLRNIPNDDELARQSAEFSYNYGGRKMLMFYDRQANYSYFGEVFKASADNIGIDIITTRSYFSSDYDFNDLISSVTGYDYDSIFISGGLPSSALLIKQLRDKGIKVPIIGGYGLDSLELWTIAGKASEFTAVPTVFNPNYPLKDVSDFVKRFKVKFGFVPDTWAAQGYDAISLLAYGIERAGSTVPKNITNTLRFIENWNGVTGSYAFTPDGDIKGKKIFFKTMDNGKFVFIKEKEKEEPPKIFDYIEDYTLRIPLEGGISTIDPGLTAESNSIELTEQLFLGLTSLEPETYQPVPEIATDWTVSSDGRNYEFHMRKDIQWTNGEPVTAHDIVWAIQRNITPKTNAPYVNILFVLKNAIAINKGEIKDVSQIGVNAKDDYTVEFILENPVSYFPTLVGLWVYRPLPRAIIEKYGDKWTELDHIQSNGSYKLALSDKNIVILRKNPLYYNAKKVSIPEVRYYLIPQVSMGFVMYQNNEIDIIGGSYLKMPLNEIPNIKQNPYLSKQYKKLTQFSTYSYAFNTKRPPTDNVLVRKAISAAIDRPLLIEVITMGGEMPAKTYTTPPIVGSVDPSDNIGIGFAPFDAKKWLAEAGYPEGKGFPEITLLFNKSETHQRIAQAISDSLKHYLNINVRIIEKDWDEYMSIILDSNLTNNPHIFKACWNGDYPDASNWLSLFNPLKPSFNTGWENNEYVQLIAQAEKESDPKQREKYYNRLEKILCQEQAIAIPLYFESAHCLVKPRVKGWYYMAMGGQHIRNWSLGEETE